MSHKTLKKNKLQVGILGTGNIGSDLLVKINRSPLLTCALFVGKQSQSEGMTRARSMGIRTSDRSIQAFIDHPEIVDIVFDATSAAAGAVHAPILKRLKKYVIDLTPSRVGQLCVPILNLDKSLAVDNVNMISCGGQANTPLIAAMLSVHPEIAYVEIVSSISSYSAGIGTRNNIDEYTQTTSEAIMELTGVPKAKTIIILNPADPPIYMHNTIYAQVDRPDMDKLTSAIGSMVKKIAQYVPGYKLINGPVFENNRITTMTEVIGLGDYLPTYAGNLDIINCAAVAVAEAYARKELRIKNYE